MRGFRARSSLRRSCRRPSADETKLPVAREKKTSGTQGICIYFKTENWLKRWKYNSMRNASSI